MPAPRGTVALAFSDIEGSTTHWERHGEKFSGALARHNAIMRAALADCDGFEVKTEGDSFMVAFASASQAARFALAAQEALSREKWPADVGEVRVRIGIHLGEPLVVEEASGRIDYLGPVVNRAARIAQAAHGGQVLVSEALLRAAGEALSGAVLADIGDHRLRGIERPERLWSILPASLATRRFPPPNTLSVAATNLPFPANSFVGRERELEEVAVLLATDGVRLVTLTGPGGTGKTRLSLRLGADLLDRFPDGVWFADLTEARDAAGVAQAVAAALHVPLTGCCPPEEAMGDVLELRKPLLLILDNFEQVVDAAPATVGAWLRRAPKLRVLATSRFLLGVAGEREIALEPLSSPARPGTPPTVADVAAHDAVRLFLERALEADPKFALTPANASDVAALCAELDGMPLALELAAARVRVLSPAQIVARLADKFRLLVSTRRDLPSRQRSLAGAIEWSWGLLEDWERSAFAQICVFRGGFDLEAAEAVLDLASFPAAPAAMDVVQRLRERSFLRGSESKSGLRFNVYVALREFGEAWWQDHAAEPEKRALDRRFTSHFLSWAERWAACIPTARALEAFDALDLERDNLFAASGRARSAGNSVASSRLTLACAALLMLRGPWDQRVPRLEAALAHASPPESVLLQARLAEALWDTGEGARATRESEAALEKARDLAHPATLLVALTIAANVLAGRGDVRGSLALREESLALARAEGDVRTAAMAQASAAMQYLRKGNRAATVAASDEALRGARASGDPWVIARVLGTCANIYSMFGEFESASGALDEAERIFRSLGDAVGAARMAASAGQRRAFAGSRAEGEAQLARAEIEFRRSGNREGVVMTLLDRGVIRKHLGDLDGALDLFTQCEALARSAGVSRTLGMALYEKGSVHVRRNDAPAAEACLDAATVILEAQEDERGLLSVLNARAHLAHNQGDHAGALASYREATERARRAGDLDGEATFRSNAAMMLLELGRPEEALSVARAAAEGYARASNTAGRASSLLTCARSQQALGRDDEALAAARDCLRDCDATGRDRPDVLTKAAEILVATAAAIGGAELAREALDRAASLGWLENPPAEVVEPLRRLRAAP
ncbi:MAG: adenylate/guanylate cyclase domain-containing protein [Planctomycetota bacterium]